MLTLKVNPAEPSVGVDALGHYQSPLDKEEEVSPPGESGWVYSFKWKHHHVMVLKKALCSGTSPFEFKLYCLLGVSSWANPLTSL